MTYTPGSWQRSTLAPLYIIAGHEPDPICSMGEYGEDGAIEGVFKNAEANARLIMAAPELLSACEVAWKLLNGLLTDNQLSFVQPDGSTARSRMGIVQLAIAKATK